MILPPPVPPLLPPDGTVEPTPAQLKILEKQAARTAKRLLLSSTASSSATAVGSSPSRGAAVVGVVRGGGFLPRTWDKLTELSSGGRRVTILTWNLLAQGLVRRTLFPGSDCLKSKDRLPPLMAELLHYSPTIACLQEVDRMEDHEKALGTSYEWRYHIGYRGKVHGLVIAWKKGMYELAGEENGRLDELPIFGQAGSIPTRGEVGLSRSTRNVFLLVALKELGEENEGKGIIVGTIHAFWHPRHTYERARQIGIFFSQAKAFKASDPQYKDWEIVLAGDYNTEPGDVTYSLLMHEPLSLQQIQDLEISKVVHESVDKIWDPKFIPGGPERREEKEGEEGDEKEEGEEEDPEHKIIRNARAGTEIDGLMSVESMMRLYGWSTPEIEASTSSSPPETISLSSLNLLPSFPPPVSAYGSLSYLFTSFTGKRYEDRPPLIRRGHTTSFPADIELHRLRSLATHDEKLRSGAYEPMFTNFTPLWRLSLDYIFLVRDHSEEEREGSKFEGLLGLHRTEEMEPGLPRKGIEPSDHIALCAEIHLL